MKQNTFAICCLALSFSTISSGLFAQQAPPKPPSGAIDISQLSFGHPRLPDNPVIAKWVQIGWDLENAIVRKDEKKEQEASQALFALDTDKMPPEWRQAFIEEQLSQYSRNGDWKGMLGIKNKLMNKKRKSKTDDLYDADLLLKISGYYCSNPVFQPPKELQKRGDLTESSKFAFKYAEKNYEDDKEKENVLQYIIDNFDPDYAPVAYARFNLACTQSSYLNKQEQALIGYQAVNDLYPKKLYCLPKVYIAGNIIKSPEDVLKQAYPEFTGEGVEWKKDVRDRMFTAIDRLDTDGKISQAIQELRAMRKKYLADDEMRKKIEERLRELSLKSDEVIPAEELGLPKVTTGTLLTTNTQLTSSTK